MYRNANKKTSWTRDQVRSMLSTDKRWMERAIVMLFEQRQVPTEQAAKQTHLHNGIGFQQMDARFFSICALMIKKNERMGRPAGDRLYDASAVARGRDPYWPLRAATKPWGRKDNKIPRIAKYARQVLDEIERRA